MYRLICNNARNIANIPFTWACPLAAQDSESIVADEITLVSQATEGLPTAPAFLKALKFSVKAAACFVQLGEPSEG